MSSAAVPVPAVDRDAGVQRHPESGRWPPFGAVGAAAALVCTEVFGGHAPRGSCVASAATACPWCFSYGCWSPPAISVAVVAMLGDLHVVWLLLAAIVAYFAANLISGRSAGPRSPRCCTGHPMARERTAPT